MQTPQHQKPPPELRTFAEAHLGDVRDARACGHPHAESQVWSLTGERQAFLKVLRQKGKFTQELYAYRTWLPHLEPLAPQLIAADEAQQALLISALPGVLLEHANLSRLQVLEAYSQAGAFLRGLHSLPHLGNDSFSLSERYRQRARSWLARAEGIVEGSLCEWVSNRVTEVSEAFKEPTIRSVPCHLDYTGRNWLVTSTARGLELSVIDFEHSRLDCWLSDVEKLNLDGWAEGTEAAFWQGYGRQPTAEEAALADNLAAFAALRVVVWAREHHDRTFEAKGWKRLRELATPRG